jgi:trimethylamine--corrinoid protein Co-methyltransferase
VFENRMPRYDILSEESMSVLDTGWRRIVSEIGVEFMSPWAVELLGEAGQMVEGENVKFDPDWILNQVEKIPSEFNLRARNPKNNVHIGGNSMVFGGVYGPPFVREGNVRRDATFKDFENFCKLAQSFDALDSVGGVVFAAKDI